MALIAKRDERQVDKQAGQINQLRAQRSQKKSIPHRYLPAIVDGGQRRCQGDAGAWLKAT